MATAVAALKADSEVSIAGADAVINRTAILHHINCWCKRFINR